MRVLVTPTFDRTAKKLHPQQKADLDDAVRAVTCDRAVGETKVGDLAGMLRGVIPAWPILSGVNLNKALGLN